MNATGNRSFHTMCKPHGSICNLDCSYCFYLSREALLGSESGFRMADRVLEEYVRQYIGGVDTREVIFSWQGGEPSLMGLDFFTRVVELQKKYAKPGQTILNDLQSNCTLLDDKWCEFLKENNFLVGLSIDGPRDLHDRYRKDKGGGKTFDRVMASVKLLRKHGVEFNTLTCLNRANAREPLRVYKFLRDEVKSERIQFIPIVEPNIFKTVAPGLWDKKGLPKLGSKEAKPGKDGSYVHDWSVDPDDFGDFMCAVFDEWYRKDFGKVFVYFFETAIAQWMGGMASLCVFAPSCGRGVMLEHDGKVYSCDHYGYPEYMLGSIMETPLDQLVACHRQTEFGNDKHMRLPRYCRDCQYVFACNGECPKNRFLLAPDGAPGLNYLCSGLKKYFAHIDSYIDEIIRRLDAKSQEAGNQKFQLGL